MRYGTRSGCEVENAFAGKPRSYKSNIDPVGARLPREEARPATRFYDPVNAFSATLRSTTGNAPSCSTAA
ncbi:hypothetical protein C1X41_20330 [Pseudomonas sp. GW460-11-11-14-LB11]|nr:hypothetical protein C1X41_20330 [Pseudomonas sp. GW460-11-11-14-LB11]